MVFQDPYSSLNPRQTVGEILEEPIQIHRLVNGPQETKKEIERVLNRVGLPADSVSRYPHEFSGGQRQRIGLARALMVRPDLLICDEPVSALDVSIQAQIINLLEDLKRDLNLTVVFISHDLRVVYQMSDFVAVMYLGRIVEYGPSEEVFSAPQHPYTQVLLSSVPHIRKGNEARIKLKGEPPNALTPPSGCTFHPRCPKSRPSCQMEVPNLEQRGLRRVACPITD
jgi:oligopeptide/dipeptide ABC transporter ATP-binding protein